LSCPVQENRTKTGAIVIKAEAEESISREEQIVCGGVPSPSPRVCDGVLNQIESAVAKSVFDGEKKLRDQALAVHPGIERVTQGRFKWGYKILYKPLQDKVSPRI
jgi:hypothetical protein